MQAVAFAFSGAPPDGFLIDGHAIAGFICTAAAGAPPDGFLIDGHRWALWRLESRTEGAPPDGFLIDGHVGQPSFPTICQQAHRLTGFSSMDTQIAWRGNTSIRLAHRLTGFSSMDTNIFIFIQFKKLWRTA